MLEPQSASWPALQRGTCRLCAAQLLVTAPVSFWLLHSFNQAGMHMALLIIGFFASVRLQDLDAVAVAVSTFGRETIFPLAAGTSCIFRL